MSDFTSTSSFLWSTTDHDNVSAMNIDVAEYLTMYLSIRVIRHAHICYTMIVPSG